MLPTLESVSGSITDEIFGFQFQVSDLSFAHYTRVKMIDLILLALRLYPSIHELRSHELGVSSAFEYETCSHLASLYPDVI